MTESSHALKRSVLVGFVCSLVVFAGGCPFPAGGTVSFVADDSGRDVTVDVGAKLIVKLASNPSTGYAWELDELDTAVVEHTTTSFRTSCLIPTPGCGGTDTWTFTAVAPGTTLLRMIYHQSWEDEEPAETFELNVTVTATE